MAREQTVGDLKESSGAIDNGGTPSATSIRPNFQTVVAGDVMPATPGAADVFVVAKVDPLRDLVLTVPDGRGGNAVAWEHVLDPLPGGRTRLLVRGHASSHWVDRARTAPTDGHRRIFVERAYAALAMLPRPLLIAFATLGHRIMEARHLRGIQRRSTAPRAQRRRVSHFPPLIWFHVVGIVLIRQSGDAAESFPCKSLIYLAYGWLAALDDFRNWLIREAA